MKIKLNITSMPMDVIYKLRKHGEKIHSVSKWQRRNIEKSKNAESPPPKNRRRKMMPAKLYQPRWGCYNGGCNDGEAEQEMDLVLYPHDVLKTPTQQVPLGYIKSEEFKHKISGMFQVMYRRGGIGLAAPQVGWNARVIIGNPYGRAHHDSGAFILINPEIAPFGPAVTMTEGCLSIPGLYAEVARPASTMVRSFTFEGVEKEVVFDGILARIVQHEFDHLDGTLFIDRLDWAELNRVKPALDLHISRIGQLRLEREAEALRIKEEQDKKKEEEKRAKEEAKKNSPQGKKKPKKDLQDQILGLLGLIHGGNQKVSQKEFDKFLRKKAKEKDNG